jgi:hypothetical protein
MLSLFSHPYDAAAETTASERLESLPVIDGESIVIIDVSGSMLLPNGAHSRLKLAAALAAEISIRSEICAIYATAGNDTDRKHSTVPLNSSGYLLWLQIKHAADYLGGGGIFLDQALEYIRHYHVKPNNLFVLTDDHIGDYIPTFFRDNLYVANLATYGEYEFHAASLGLLNFSEETDAT